MSILKFANGKNKSISQVEEALKYINNPDKTNKKLCAGFGVDYNCAFEDMKTVKRLMNKDTGRQYIHFIISYDSYVTSQQALKIGKRCAEFYADEYQLVMATHVNTSNVHNHFIINTVNVQTGKKFSQSCKEFYLFRDFVNGILRENKLNLVGNEKEIEYVIREYEDFELFSGNEYIKDDINKTNDFEILPHSVFMGTYSFEDNQLLIPPIYQKVKIEEIEDSAESELELVPAVTYYGPNDPPPLICPIIYLK